MPRTRDFVLLFSCVVFLVMAITATALSNRSTVNDNPLTFTDTADIEREAVLDNGETITTADRLASMREKIASAQLFNEPTNILDEAPLQTNVATDSAVADSSLVRSEQQCTEYSPLMINWSPQNLQFEAVEGARLIYRPTSAEVEILNASGTVVGTEMIEEKEVIVQLPVRSTPLPTPTCISHDVIGIATDGSLIRNTEVGLYGVFSSETLIGYALDGFPIYGRGVATTDVCGGLMAPDGYRYQLSSDQPVMLYCFSGAPVQL